MYTCVWSHINHIYEGVLKNSRYDQLSKIWSNLFIINLFFYFFFLDMTFWRSQKLFNTYLLLARIKKYVTNSLKWSLYFLPDQDLLPTLIGPMYICNVCPIHFERPLKCVQILLFATMFIFNNINVRIKNDCYHKYEIFQFQ